MIFVPALEFQVGLCLYVTAAVRGGSPRASRTWSQRPKFVQGSLEPVASLVPPPPPSLPLSFFAFWGFPEWNTQDLPSLQLFVAGNTFLSLLSLSLPLSFFPSLFPHLSSLYPLPWVSLDAFVIAGNPFPLFLWCVPGRLCRSWEHLLPLSFLLFLFLFSPYPSLPSGP